MQLHERLYQLWAESGRSLADVARLGDLEYTTAYRMVQAEAPNPHAGNLLKFLRGLDLDWGDLAGVDEVPTLQREIRNRRRVKQPRS